jgi:hypothetical protein
MYRKSVVSGLCGVACGVVLASIAWSLASTDLGNVSKIDEPDEQIIALEKAYQDMVRSKPAMREPTEREIIMFTRDGCAWCDKWLAEQYQPFKDLGYKIAICEGREHSFNPVPQFQVTNEEGKKQYVGYISASQFLRKK